MLQTGLGERENAENCLLFMLLNKTEKKNDEGKEYKRNSSSMSQ